VTLQTLFDFAPPVLKLEFCFRRKGKNCFHRYIYMMHRGVRNCNMAAVCHFPMVQAEFEPEVPLFGLQTNIVSALMQVDTAIGFY
jgi:hypothetical protein